MRWAMLFLLGLSGCNPTRHVVLTQMAPQPFCTRTLGVVECFANPVALTDRPSRVGDTPVRTHVVCDPVWRDGGLPCLLTLPSRP